jgi:hypothetical protein
MAFTVRLIGRSAGLGGRLIYLVTPSILASAAIASIELGAASAHGFRIGVRLIALRITLAAPMLGGLAVVRCDHA